MAMDLERWGRPVQPPDELSYNSKPPRMGAHVDSAMILPLHEEVMNISESGGLVQ